MTDDYINYINETYKTSITLNNYNTFIDKQFNIQRENKNTDLLSISTILDYFQKTSFVCRNCNTNKYLVIYSVQIRKGDEALSNFYKCLKCNILNKI